MRLERFATLEAIVTGGPDGKGGGDGPVVVLLHGFGAPPADLAPLADELAAPPGVRFVFPAAPLDLGWELGGGRAWWMIDIAQLERDMLSGRPHDRSAEVPEGLAEARAGLSAALDDLERRLGVGGERLLLGGFSQGAMLALDLALREPRPLAGLALLSGTLLAAAEWRPRFATRRGLRVFQSHGRADPLLPFAAAERLRDELGAAGLDVSWVDFDGGHELPPVALDGLSRFLRDALA